MRLIAIGDIHGRDTWKQVLQENEWDICVFLGDYFDSFDIDADAQVKNFEEIIRLKMKGSKIVSTLMGNHDLHYLLEGERYSGYQDNPKVHATLKRYGHHLVKACKFDELLFSHAGITKTWVANHKLDEKNIVYSINRLPLEAFKFSGTDPTGDNKEQGCLWVRPKSLEEDFWGDLTQVVGHTEVEHITPVGEKFILNDALHAGQYLYQDENGCYLKKIQHGTTS